MLILEQTVNGIQRQFDAAQEGGRVAALAQPIVTRMGEDRFLADFVP